MYTNETTHFGIPLPLGSDLTTPMDYNTAAEAVDTALFEAQGDAATANENAAAAVETANATSEALYTLSGTVGGHTSQISALGARMTNAENEIDDVRSDLEDMIVAYNEPTATSTHAYSAGDYFIYNDILYNATDSIAIGATIVPNTNCEATNVMTELKSALSDKQDTITPSAVNVTWAPTLSVSGNIVKYGDVVDFSVAFTVTGGLIANTYYQLGQLTEHIPNTTTYIIGVVENSTQDCVIGYIDSTDGSIHVKCPVNITNETIIINSSYVTTN
jgi:hypothetical protein